MRPEFTFSPIPVTSRSSGRSCRHLLIKVSIDWALAAGRRGRRTTDDGLPDDYPGACSSKAEDRARSRSGQDSEEIRVR